MSEVLPTDLEAWLANAGLAGALPSGAVDRVRAYFAERERWARVHNLAGPKAREEPATVDLLDAVALYSALMPDLLLVDVGAGSGVPGLLLAALDPARPVLLVEPAAKRAAFLRTAAAALGFRRVGVRRERWPFDPGEPSQLVSRAVFPVADWPAAAAGAGDQVRVVHRYLAAERPPFGVPGFARAGQVSYRCGAADRLLETWGRA